MATESKVNLPIIIPSNNLSVVKMKKQSERQHHQQAVAAAAAVSSQKNMTKWNRFSDEEKSVLYRIFSEHLHIIDIKKRKNAQISNQMDVRSCWEHILKTFNEHSDTKERTMRQIQKFWLNSK